ncbi:MAG: PqqD family protein [Xanthobacteraceae bacterium]
MLWDRAASRLMAFNAATTAIWPQIEAGRSPHQIASNLARRYGLPLERARSDVAALFAELLRLGVLGGAGFVADAEDGGVRPIDPSSPPLAQLEIRLAGLRLSIEAEAGIIAFLRPLFHGRISADGKVDRSIRVSGPATNAAVSVDGVPHSITRSHYETVGAIYEFVREALYPNADWLAIFHASAVARGDTAILLPAPSGSGKSVLVTSLVCDGYDYLSDSHACVSGRDHRVWPFPLSINLKRGSRDLVANPRSFEAFDIATPSGIEATDITHAELRDQMLAPPSAAWTHAPVRLHAVVFPRYVAGAAPALTRLTAIDALARLLEAPIYLDDRLTAQRISRLLRWVASMPCYSLVYSDLAAAKRLIADLLP